MISKFTWLPPICFLPFSPSCPALYFLLSHFLCPFVPVRFFHSYNWRYSFIVILAVMKALLVTTLSDIQFGDIQTVKWTNAYPVICILDPWGSVTEVMDTRWSFESHWSLLTWHQQDVYWLSVTWVIPGVTLCLNWYGNKILVFVYMRLYHLASTAWPCQILTGSLIQSHTSFEPPTTTSTYIYT